jgi:hypothetical protein
MGAITRRPSRPNEENIMSDTRRRAKTWPAEIPFAYARQCCVSPDRSHAHRGSAQATRHLHVPPRPLTVDDAIADGVVTLARELDWAMAIPMADATPDQLTCPFCAWDFDARTVTPCGEHAEVPTAGSNR